MHGKSQERVAGEGWGMEQGIQRYLTHHPKQETRSSKTEPQNQGIIKNKAPSIA